MPEGGTFEFDQGVNNNYKHFSLFIYRLSACPYMSLMSKPYFLRSAKLVVWPFLWYQFISIKKT